MKKVVVIHTKDSEGFDHDFFTIVEASQDIESQRLVNAALKGLRETLGLDIGHGKHQPVDYKIVLVTVADPTVIQVEA